MMATVMYGFCCAMLECVRPVVKIHFSIFFLALALVLSACATSQPVAEVSANGTAPDWTAAQSHADDLLRLAEHAEQWVTPALQYLAQQQNGELVGLEFRFKSRDSTTKKILARMTERNYTSPGDVPISDALRYTMQLDDAPAGHHGDSIAHVLAFFEQTGHTVLKVKNYWPRGDEYSGVNTNLRAPNGLEWELQFHTPESFELKMSSHLIYEQARNPDALLQTRQELYDEVAEYWLDVPIPSGILEPHSLHALEQVILRPRP